MRVVDFHAFPDRSELREQLVAAVDEADTGDAKATEPVDRAAALGVGFPDELDDDAVRERARTLRGQLEAGLSEDLEVRFELADGPSATAGGAPDHLE